MTRGFTTRSLHAGAEPDAATGARATPIHQTTSFVFDDADTAAEMYALRAEGHIYSRLSNPTVNVLEDRIADLSGGSDAVATAPEPPSRSARRSSRVRTVGFETRE